MGTATDVANQTLWLSEFENQVSPSLKGVGSALDIYSNSWSYEVQWKANRQIIELTRFL